MAFSSVHLGVVVAVQVSEQWVVGRRLQRAAGAAAQRQELRGPWQGSQHLQYRLWYEVGSEPSCAVERS